MVLFLQVGNSCLSQGTKVDGDVGENITNRSINVVSPYQIEPLKMIPMALYVTRLLM